MQGSSRLLVVVDIEEVRVEEGLDDAGDDGNRLEGSLEGGLGEVSPDPVGDIECPIQAEREQIVCSNRVRFSSALQHEQLGQNGDRLQPNRERPKDLDKVSRMSSF